MMGLLWQIFFLDGVKWNKSYHGFIGMYHNNEEATCIR